MNTEFSTSNQGKRTRILFFLIYLFVSFFSYSQSSREEVVKRYLNIGKQLVKEGNYDSASQVLKSAFIKNAVLPDELLYYYSFSLYKQGDLDQSKKLVDKFLTLSTKQSELYAQATSLDSAIIAAIDDQSIICNNCNGWGLHFHPCTHCNHTGEQKCEVCSGKGTVLIGGSAGMKFGKCITCMGDGMQTCKVCKGKKQTEEQCTVCKGKGKIRKKMEAKG